MSNRRSTAVSGLVDANFCSSSIKSMLSLIISVPVFMAAAMGDVATDDAAVCFSLVEDTDAVLFSCKSWGAVKVMPDNRS